MIDSTVTPFKHVVERSLSSWGGESGVLPYMGYIRYVRLHKVCGFRAVLVRKEHGLGPCWSKIEVFTLAWGWEIVFFYKHLIFRIDIGKFAYERKWKRKETFRKPQRLCPYFKKMSFS